MNSGQGPGTRDQRILADDSWPLTNKRPVSPSDQTRRSPALEPTVRAAGLRAHRRRLFIIPQTVTKHEFRCGVKGGDVRQPLTTRRRFGDQAEAPIQRVGHLQFETEQRGLMT
jgi:hypothetical protein